MSSHSSNHPGVLGALKAESWIGSSRGIVRLFRDANAIKYEAACFSSNPSMFFSNGQLPYLWNPNVVSTAEIETEFRRILDLDFFQLKSELQEERREGGLNAFTVLCAYMWRALQIDRHLNCITQVITEAFDRARELDSSTEPKGPLFGLPFSVKSSLAVKGYPVTLGLAKFIEKKEEETSSFVQLLIKQGAVPFCLTNVPQGLLSYVTSNPLFGTTRNPWAFERTPGGSSGGEAALVSAGGAVFGIGSDLGGGLRIPAALCSLVTLKLTNRHRFDVTGAHDGIPGRGRLPQSFGFLTHTVAEQEFLLQTTVGYPNFRDLCPESSAERIVPYQRRPKGDGPFRIGFLSSYGVHPIAPSNRRAVIDTKNAILAHDRNLRQQEDPNHRSIEFTEITLNNISNFPAPSRLVEMFLKNANPDVYKDEPTDEFMAPFIKLINDRQYSVVRFFSRVAVWLIEFFYSPILALMGGANNGNLSNSQQNIEETDQLQAQFVKFMDNPVTKDGLRGQRLDAIICPAFITPAQNFKYPAQLMTCTNITGLFNMVEVPAGIVPVGRVQYWTDTDIEEVTTGMTRHKDDLARKIYESLEGSNDLPIAVQIITRPNEEALLLYVMKLVEEVMKPNVYRLQLRATPSLQTNTLSRKYFARFAVVPREQIPQNDAQNPIPAPEQDAGQNPNHAPEQDAAHNPIPAPEQGAAQNPIPAPEQGAAQNPNHAPEQDAAHNPIPAPEQGAAQNPNHAPEQDAAHNPIPAPEQGAAQNPIPAAEPAPGQEHRVEENQDEGRNQPILVRPNPRRGILRKSRRIAPAPTEQN